MKEAEDGAEEDDVGVAKDEVTRTEVAAAAGLKRERLG